MMINKDYIQLIKVATEARFEVSIALMEAKTRKREVVIARQAAMAIMLELVPGVSLKYIGSEFGGRDHSTVIHSRLSVSNMIDTDKIFRIAFTDVLGSCKLKIDTEEAKAEKERLDATEKAKLELENKLEKERLKNLVMEKRVKEFGYAFS